MNSPFTDSQRALLSRALLEGDKVSRALDSLVVAPFVVTLFLIAGTLFFLLIPDSMEPWVFGLIAVIFGISFLTKIYSDKRARSAFVDRAKALGVDSASALQFADTFDWDEVDDFKS